MSTFPHREIDDDQTGGAQGGQTPHAPQAQPPPVLHQPIMPQPPVMQPPSGQFVDWQALNVQQPPASAQNVAPAFQTPATTYSGRFLSQSTRYVSQRY